MHAAMSNSLAVACKAWVLGGVLLTGACAVYVNRAESAYNEGRYLEVAEQLAKREAEVRQGALPQGMPRLNPANAS